MKKHISLALSAVMLLNTAAEMSVSAAAEGESSKKYTHNGYSITYNVVNEWTGNQNINVTITNTGEEEICGWAVKYETEGTINGLWNGKLYYENDDTRVVASQSYNSAVKPNNSITFGYTLSGENFEFPEEMILCNEWKEAEETIEVSYKLLEDWGETYQAQVSISNNSETQINCWKLGFNLTGSISEIWDSVLLSEENGTVIVSNNETNSTIAPENKANFSFIAKKNKDETPELSDFILYENYINIEKDFEEIVPEIMGYADFNEDLLTINWYSTIEDGKFEVLKSLDNETFEVIEELENEKSYKYGEIDFEKAYFKIRQTLSDGRTAESAAVAVVYENGEFKWEYIDTDEDGIPDIYEESIGTDITNPDTDEDGLTDYEEIYLTNSDPLVYNSVNEEVSDSEADPDEDGVSNRTEIDNGTNPLLADSDYDGINDGEEAKIGTDPVSSDTDNDGIADGDELTLNLDPTSDTTDGIKDSERTTLQEIEADSEIMSGINTDENPMKVSIEFEAAGLAESSLDVSESGYSSAMSNSAIVGAIPEFSYPEGLSTGEVTVKFSVAESVKENTLGTYAEECEELKGIKRFNVFKYFEDTNMLLPIETFHDEEKGVIYTKTDCLGTYCVMDLELWMQNLGVEATTEELTETVDVSYLSAEEDEDAFEGLDNGNLNVVFFLDARCSISEEKFNSLKGFVCDALDDILSSYMLGVNLMVMISRGDKTVEVYSASSAESIDVIRNLTQDPSSVPYGYSRTISVTACFDKLYEICKDNTNDTLFIMNVSEEEITAQISTSKEVFEKVRDNGKIHISLISETRTTEMISYVVNLIKETDGKIIRARTEAIKSYVGEYLSDSYSIITANNYELVKLDNRLERDSGTDTDDDELSDWSEVDIEAVYELGGDSVNGKSYLEMYDMPTVAQCIDRYDDEHFYVESGFNQFHSEHSKRWEEYIKSIRITPIISDPTNVDSDGDGLEDVLDNYRLIHNIVLDEEATEAINNYLYYFLGIIVPPAYDDNGNLITSNNRDCKATRKYFKEYIWPYLKEIEWEKYNYNPNYEHVVEQQHNNAFISWSREAYGLTPLESLWFVSNDIGDISYYFSMTGFNEIVNFWNTMNLAMKQVILGNYCDEVTITGTAGQIALSIAGVDLVADIRDVTYDFTNWEWKWSHAGQTALDSVGLLPVIGVVKNIDSIKNIDELISSIKTLDKFTETIICNDKVVDGIKNIINNADDITKAKIFKNPDIWAKLSTNIGENSDIVVLGKFNMDGVSYLDVADELNATYYNNPYWDELNILCGEDAETMWKINEQFLKTQTDAGKTIIFSHNPYIEKYWKQANGDISSFKKEIDFLRKDGVDYIISDTPNSDGFYYAVKNRSMN